MTATVTVEVEGKHLRLSNLDKVLYPRTGFTKGQVIDYYNRVSKVILPHVESRPLTLKRYPSGVDEEFFFEKQCPSHAPEWITKATMKTPGSSRRRDEITFCLIDSLPSLMWVANLASIELHVLLSRAPELERPTSMVFDLDPGEPAGLEQCAVVAIEIRRLLKAMGLECLVKSSGGKGLHVWAPLNTPATFGQTKDFAHAFAELMARHNKLVISNMRKELRKGKVFVDWSQNDSFKTTVCVYSLRAQPAPTVSAPLQWEEVHAVANGGDTEAIIFSPDQVLRRIAKLGDLFEPAVRLKQKLPDLSDRRKVG